MDLHDGEPFWPKRGGLPHTFPPLLEDRTCDVVVVGGGITGALIAWRLVQAGFEVVVLERRDVAGGSTSASTSMLQYEIDELLVDLAETFGWEVAATAYQECSRGIDLVEQAVAEIGAPCGFRRSPSVFVATKKRDIELLRRELTARERAGFEVRWLDADELNGRWGLVGHGAIESAQGASIDPYRFAYAGLAEVAERGGSVYDRTAAAGYEFSPRRVVVTTDRGSTVRAKWCVMATGYEVERLLPDLPFVLHSSFAFVSEPVPGLGDRYPDGVLFWEHADPYLYGRTTDDGRVLVGGKDEQYRDPHRRRRALPHKVRALETAIGKFLPDVPLEVGYAWAGTFAETPDGLAYLGRHPAFPRCRFALGFGGNGITYSALAADYIVRDLQGIPSPEAQVFRLDRPVERPS